MNSIITMEAQIEREKMRLNNDQHHIHLLHDYNYLKDSVFTLCDFLSNIKKCSGKAIFEEFEIVDLEAGKWLGKSKV